MHALSIHMLLITNKATLLLYLQIALDKGMDTTALCYVTVEYTVSVITFVDVYVIVDGAELTAVLVS